MHGTGCGERWLGLECAAQRPDAHHPHHITSLHPLAILPPCHQDVGLIFLSAMASSIAAACGRAGLDAAAALGTTLLTMALSTALVGLGLIAVARLRLAGAVNYLPLPAVGGYLSYVGEPARE